MMTKYCPLATNCRAVSNPKPKRSEGILFFFLFVLEQTCICSSDYAYLLGWWSCHRDFYIKLMSYRTEMLMMASDQTEEHFTTLSLQLSSLLSVTSVDICILRVLADSHSLIPFKLLTMGCINIYTVISCTIVAVFLGTQISSSTSSTGTLHVIMKNRLSILVRFFTAQKILTYS